MADKNVSQDVRSECEILTRKLAQLEALLHATYGEAQEGFYSMADVYRDNYMWACADLAEQCKELTESIGSAVYKAVGTSGPLNSAAPALM